MVSGMRSVCDGNGLRGTSSSANTSVQKKSEILKKDIMETPTEGTPISLVCLLHIVRLKRFSWRINMKLQEETSVVVL